MGESLRVRLQRLKRDFDVRSGLCDRLASDGFSRIVARIEQAATEGETHKEVPIEFEGSSGGNAEHIALVGEEIIRRLRAEGLTVSDRVSRRDSNLIINWR